MDPRLESLLRQTIAAAEDQLQAARALDVGALERATARRQDLGFDLSLMERPTQEAAIHSRPLLEELQALDARLRNVLGAATRTFAAMLPSGPPTTYGVRGRLAAGRY